MVDTKAVLMQANAAIEVGDNEGFLRHCAEDIEWEVVGEFVLNGKPALRDLMKRDYVTPPQFTVTDLFSEDDMLTVMGELMDEDEGGNPIRTRYCDVWRFRDGLMAQLRAFVIAVPHDGDSSDT
jgi:ketosteroid isomerase-like protein